MDLPTQLINGFFIGGGGAAVAGTLASDIRICGWQREDRLVSIENIQKTVAEYYKLRVAELLSKRRSRSVARPRQMAMALAKELTNHSLPEIGDAFGGRDHTTVLHGCRRIAALRESEKRVDEDYLILLRTLTG